MKASAVFLLVLSFIIVFAGNTFALESSLSSTPADMQVIKPKENDIGFSRLTPDSSLYFLKGVREELELKFAMTNHVRSIRMLEYSTRRIREIKTMAYNGSEDMIPAIVERYWFNVDNYPNKSEQGGILAVHVGVFNEIYPMLKTATAKLSVRSVMYRIIQQPDVPNETKLLVCNLLQQESSSSAMTDSEREILKLRVTNCRKNL